MDTSPLFIREGEWMLVWTALTALGTITYALLVFITLRVIRGQLEELQKSRTLQAFLALFETLQSPSARQARKYIFEEIPKDLKKPAKEELEKYLDGMLDAVAAFDRIGYFLKQRYIHPDELVPLAWAMVWRCWKKTEKVIKLMRRERGEKDWLMGFQHFFDLSETHRKENKLKRPKFY